MMLLDADVIIKRIALVVGIVIVALGLAAATWYNTNLKNVFEDGKSQTLDLKQETQTLEVNLNQAIGAIADIKAALLVHDDAFVNIQQNYDQLQDLIGHEISTLLTDTQSRDQKLHTEIAQLKSQQEKFATDTAKTINSLQQQNQNLQQQIHTKSQEVQALQNKLDAEIDWRNKNWWDR